MRSDWTISTSWSWRSGCGSPHDPHGVDDDLHAQLAERFTDEQIVLLAEFGAIMVATNVFNDALGVPLDAQLEPYRAR